MYQNRRMRRLEARRLADHAVRVPRSFPHIYIFIHLFTCLLICICLYVYSYLYMYQNRRMRRLEARRLADHAVRVPRSFPRRRPRPLPWRASGRTRRRRQTGGWRP